MPIKVPKTQRLSSDIEDRREEFHDPANRGVSERTITNVFRDWDRVRAFKEIEKISNEEYMKNLSTTRTEGLEEDMRAEAAKQMRAETEHTKARSKRRASTAKKFQGVK